MITTVQQQTTEISPLDALWALYQSQTKRVRKAFLKRLMAQESKNREYALQQDMTVEGLYDVIAEEIDSIYANGVAPFTY